MPSSAFAKLEDRLKDIDALMDAHEKLTGTGRGRRGRQVLPINRAAIVFISAHLEGFLEDIFSEGMNFVLSRRMPASEVPNSIKLILLSPVLLHIEEIHDKKIKKRECEKLLKMAQELGHPRRRIHTYDINYQHILEEFQNPKPKEINWLFEQISISDILSKIHWRGFSSERVKDKLNKIIDKRNKVAHGNTKVSVYKYEITDYAWFIHEFASQIDKIVFNYLHKITGKTPW